MVNGPVLGVAQYRPGGARLYAGSEGERRPVEPVDVEQGEVVLRVVVDGGRVELDACSRWSDGGVALARDDMGVGHHQVRGSDPAGALDPEPAGGAEDADHAVARRPHVGVLGDLRVGRRDVRARALDGDARVDPVENVDQRARRREGVVERPQDRGALHGGPQALCARGVERHRSEEPGEPQRQRDQQHGSAGGLCDHDPPPAARRSEQPPPDGERDLLQRDGEDPSDQQRSRQRRGRRVRASATRRGAARGRAGCRGRRRSRSRPG